MNKLNALVNKFLVIAGLCLAFMGGCAFASIGDKPVSVVSIRYVDRPVFQKIRADHKYVLAQRDLLAAAIPARLLMPARKK